MTLNAKIGFFNGFFGDFGLRDRFQERIAPKPIEMDMDKLCMKFSALNVDFNGSSLDFYVHKTCTRGHQRTLPPQKSLFFRCWPVFCENGCR